MMSILRHVISAVAVAVAAIFGATPTPVPVATQTPTVSATVSISTPVATKIATPSPSPIAATATPAPVASKTPAPSPTPSPASTLTPSAKAVATKLTAFLAKPSTKAFLKLCADAKTMKMPNSLIVETLGKDRKSIVRTKKTMYLADLLPQCTIASTTQFIGTPKDLLKLITAPLRNDDTDARRLAILNYNLDVQTRLATKDVVAIFTNAARGTTNTTITQITFTVVLPEPGFRALLDMVNKGTLSDVTEKERTALIAKTGGSNLKFFAATDLQPTAWYETPPTRSW